MKFFTKKWGCLLFVIFGCNQIEKQDQVIAKSAKVFKDFNSFWTSLNRVDFGIEFLTTDTANNNISKKIFFEYLKSGKYFPLTFQNTEGIVKYQLYPIPDSSSIDIKSVMENWGRNEDRLFSMRGTEMPPMDFVDVAGNIYNKNNLKNKIVVVKCWFKNCAPCIEEIPLVEELKKVLSNRTDIVFMSIVTDNTSEIKKFLQSKGFDKNVIADQKQFIVEKLKVDRFPTYIIVNKDGKIFNVSNGVWHLQSALENLISN